MFDDTDEVTEDLFDDNRAVLASLSKDQSVLLNKTMLPGVFTSKEKALKFVLGGYIISTGKQNIIAQLKKQLNYKKSYVKKRLEGYWE